MFPKATPIKELIFHKAVALPRRHSHGILLQQHLLSGTPLHSCFCKFHVQKPKLKSRKKATKNHAVFPTCTIIFIHKLRKSASGKYFLRSFVWEFYINGLVSWIFILTAPFETYQPKILLLTCNVLLNDQSK